MSQERVALVGVGASQARCLTALISWQFNKVALAFGRSLVHLSVEHSGVFLVYKMLLLSIRATAMLTVR